MEKGTKSYKSPEITVLCLKNVDAIRTSGEGTEKGGKWNWGNISDNIWEE
ncbi:MAG: hypothetical protein ACI4SH_00035 [Candidatus Scatosoma sp.]